MSDETVLFREDFAHVPAGDDLPGGWWAEGGQRVWVEGGRLFVRANAPGAIAADRSDVHEFVCTVWNRTVFRGDLRVAFDAHVVDACERHNNINFFFLYSDPSGVPLFDTRGQRRSADYSLYHDLNGYIVTFLNDVQGQGGPASDGGRKARFRMRRCPGFRLLDETFGYHCRRGVTYHVELTRRGGKLSYAVDGTTFVEADDPDPLAAGLIGLRTFRTELWWDNIVVTGLT